FALNAPNPPHWTLNSCLCASRSVCVYLQYFVTTRNSVQNGLNWYNSCTSLCHEIASEFFATNGPDPPHWTINSCFGASRSVWVHLAMFHYYTKLGAKQVELVQLMHKFVP